MDHDDGHRHRRGRAVGRKIGFTNRTIWPRYGVHQPMWAHVWSHTVHFAKDGRATFDLKSFVLPRIEPEVVFKLKGPISASDDPLAVLAATEWIAPGFEIVQSHFPDWKFKAADCTAAFGLHGALAVGAPLMVTEQNRAALAKALPICAVTLSRGGTVIVDANFRFADEAHAFLHRRRQVGWNRLRRRRQHQRAVAGGQGRRHAPRRPSRDWRGRTAEALRIGPDCGGLT